MNLSLPTNWDEVLLDQFILIKSIDPEAPFYTRQHEILAILTDTTVDDPLWDDLDITALTAHIKSLNWICQEPSTNLVNTIGDLRVIQIDKLTLGEWIDLEHYFQDYYANLATIAAILYRKTRVDEWGNTIWQSHASYPISERANGFMEEPVTKFYPLIKYYLDFKTMIMETYIELFSPQVELDEGDYVPDEEDIEQEKIEAINNKWSWETVLHTLSGGDITKYDALTSMPLIFILNQLSFRREMKLE